MRKYMTCSAYVAGALVLLALTDSSTGDSPPVINITVEPMGGQTTVNDMAWMAGAWYGEGLGGQLEEHWSAPAGGSMMGMFRLVPGEGRPNVYELLLIEQQGEKVRYTFRHFGPGHKPWEPPDKPLVFELIERSPTLAVFHSPEHQDPQRLTYQRTGKHTMTIQVQGEKDGALTEGFKLEMHRKLPGQP